MRVLVTCILALGIGLLPQRLGIRIVAGGGDLVQQADLTFTGGFRTNNTEEYWIGASIAGLGPDGDTLYMRAGADLRWIRFVGEISIPASVNTATLSEMTRATEVQPTADIYNGNVAGINGGNPSSTAVGGVLVRGSDLIVTRFIPYDANQDQAPSHYVTGQNFSSLPTVTGPYQIGKAGLVGNVDFPTTGGSPAGWVGNYMTPIPASWQASFGGADTFAGLCCVSIISRTSQGPAGSVFDIDAITGSTGTPVPAKVVLGYNGDHMMVAGGWDGRGTGTYGKATAVGGVVWIENSVLFWGRVGTAGNACYGVGTTDADLGWPSTNAETRCGLWKIGDVPTPGPACNVPPEGGVASGDDEWCTDPTDTSSHGEHAYPYFYKVWAYRASDLAAAYAGSVEPWEVLPYAEWNPTFPIEKDKKVIGGVAYNPDNRTIYVAAVDHDVVGFAITPLIYTYTVAAPTPAWPVVPIASVAIVLYAVARRAAHVVGSPQ